MTVDMKEQINNLINALLTLSASRNYVIQFLRMLPEDFRVISEAYPEILQDEKVRSLLTKIFGVQIGPKVELGYGFGSTLKSWSESIAEFFKKEEVRETLQNYLRDVRTEEIPDLAKEWLEIKLQIISSEPTYGKDTIKTFQCLVESKELSFEEMCLRTKLSEVQMRSVLDLLNKFGLIDKITVAGKEGYRVYHGIQNYIPYLLTFLPKLLG